MGPASESAKGISATNPPMFDPAADLQEWRRNVCRWVETITAAAEKGSDRLYKTIAATLARQLYDRGLPSAQKSIVEEAQANGLINYKQDDQMLGVRDIIELIAVDPPIAVVSRLIASFNQVNNCRRKRAEDSSSFVSRFRDLAADHLMHGGLSSSSQVGEVLAITLLNNANLSEETLTNAKSQLISLAKARDSQQQLSVENIPEASLAKIRDVSTSLSTMHREPNMRILSADTASSLKLKIRSSRNKIEQLSKTLSESLEVAGTKDGPRDSVGEKILRTAPRCRLNLDDAVVVLRNLSFSPSKEVHHYSKDEIENIVGQKVQKAILAFNKSANKGGSSSKQEKRKTSTKSAPKSNKRKAEDRGSARPTMCYDCGSNSHLRGSASCNQPSFLTKKIRSEGGYPNLDEDEKSKAVANPSPEPLQNAQGAGSSDNPHFRKGSNPTKRSHR